MDDKERMEFLIKHLGVSNVEFAAKTGIAPATLSHITSGRSKPTLTILRGIIAGYPELNPEWVLMGTGTMYKDTAKSQIENTSKEVEAGLGDVDLFSALDSEIKSHQKENRNGQGFSTEEVVKATVAAMSAAHSQPRKVVEIRVFFDDGTYQEFN